MAKNTPNKLSSYSTARNHHNNLQAGRPLNPVTRTQTAPALLETDPQVKAHPLYSYRDVAYAAESADGIRRTPQRVYIATEREADEWVPKLSGVIGFDMEWPYDHNSRLSGKTSMIQVSDEHVILLIHIAKMEAFPTRLKELVESPKVVKTGFWIVNDFAKLKVDYGVTASMYVELADIAKAVDERGLRSRGLINEFGRPKLTLSSIVFIYLDKVLSKEDGVRVSDWSKDLSEGHMEYAANDAHASLVLFKTLHDLGTTRSIDLDLGVLEIRAKEGLANRVREWTAQKVDWDKAKAREQNHRESTTKN